MDTTPTDRRQGAVSTARSSEGVKSRKPIVLSPLRYPGSKRQLLPAIEPLLSAAGEPIEFFVEPFAGGASVSLQLAAWGSVSRAILADVDPLIYSFWKTCTEDSGWLIDEVMEIEVSLAMWERMKSADPSSVRDRALKCLFLNRTNFSGILHERAGPIGGKSQRHRKIDCRFPRERLVGRIETVADLANTGRIAAVWPFDYRTTLSEIRRLRRPGDTTIVFLDPPFFAKSQKLYRHGFKDSDHTELSRIVRRMKLPYILSYDDHEEVRALYNGSVYPRTITKEYRAAAATRRTTTSELIVTNIANAASD